MHDPCLLNTFFAATRFMAGEPPLPWWRYTKERKRTLKPSWTSPTVPIELAGLLLGIALLTQNNPSNSSHNDSLRKLRS